MLMRNSLFSVAKPDCCNSEARQFKSDLLNRGFNVDYCEILEVVIIWGWTAMLTFSKVSEYLTPPC